MDDGLLRDLNRRQLEAVTAPDGPLLILAGAGSGKTRVLTRRAGYLLTSGRARADDTCVVTFTNKAAREIKDRLVDLVGNASTEGMWTGTIHSLGAWLLRDLAPLTGRTAAYSIFDTSDQESALAQALTELGVTLPRHLNRPAILRRLSAAKDELLSPAAFKARVRSDEEGLLASIYHRYQQILQAANAVDFDDLIRLPVVALERNADAQSWCRTIFRQVLVDEYQDTSAAQYRLISLLVGEHRNLTVVGDDDQAIFGFRGADVRNILSFKRDFPDARIVTLDQNYRSTSHILDAAFGVIQHNPQRAAKRLWTQTKGGDQLRLIEAQTESSEASMVATNINRLVGTGRFRWRDVAVLYRTNAQADPLQRAFMRESIPYRVVSGLRFYDRQEARDILAYLRLVHNPKDVVAFGRAISTPRRGVGRVTLERIDAERRATGAPPLEAMLHEAVVAAVRPSTAQALREFRDVMQRLGDVAHSASIGDLVRAAALDTGYRAWLEQSGGRTRVVDEMVAAAQEIPSSPGLGGLAQFLAQVALTDGHDGPGRLDRAPPDAVTLITVHQCKGLEFPAVFLTGMEEGTFPHSAALAEGTDAEERRLAYVGITRAMRLLCISFARRRLITTEVARQHGYAIGEHHGPSRFLSDIPPSCVERRSRHRLPAPTRALDLIRCGP